MFNQAILTTNKELEIWRKQQTENIIFVPTMGGLHAGHQKLIEVAQELSNKNQSVVLVSIFVNPLQFGRNEDYEEYPRTLEKDCEIALKAGANAIWAPSIEQVFHGGTESHFELKAPSKLKTHLCGGHRENHFDGVATVVIRLLNLVQPTMLILGEKDWQQLIILKKLIIDLNLKIKVKSVPTVRDIDGLACSTRNKYLDQIQRKKALILPMELFKFAKRFNAGNHLNLKTIRNSLEDNDLTVEYVEIVDPEYLQPLEEPSQICLLAAAVHIGTTRLIDHKFLMKRPPIVAIDGPAGAGKSTVTKAFAKRMGLLYLDTGAMYRAVTWLIQKKEINPENQELIKKELRNINLEFKQTSNGDQQVLINGNDITKEIRSPEVTSKVSTIAAQSSVREVMTYQQKQIGKDGGIVAEGRDIGTTVFPDAELKIFLTATPKERAKRRAQDLTKRGFSIPSGKELENEIIKRDLLDSTRRISPLTKAADAKEVLTDGMSIDQVIEVIIEMFRFKVPEELWPTPEN